MGVIYKLKPEINDFILEEKKNKPILSCRELVILIENKFQIKVSKSSINAIIKEAGLSMPVGRRLKKRRRKPQIPLLLETEPRMLIEAPLETPVEKVVEEFPVEKTTEKPVEPLIEVPLQKAPEVILKPLKAEELPSETGCTGAILLKAADFLTGGSFQFAEVIKNWLNPEEGNILAKTNSLIYMSLFEISDEKSLAELWAMADKKIAPETLMRYLTELQQVKQLPLDMFGVIPSLFQEVRCVKVSLSDGAAFYLDAQLQTIWSTPQIPDDFSTTIYNIKSYINKYFKEDRPFMLFSSPGYEIPTKEFFDFILGLEAGEKNISKLTLYDHKFEVIESISLEPQKRRSFIFGLWPWQFGQYRKAKLRGDFRQFYFEPLKENFYLADIEIELLQPVMNKRVILRGCALKTNLNEKIRLIILSNLDEEKKAEELANLYLNRWPNLERGFQDFSRKIELFTYTASSHPVFSIEDFSFNREIPPDINTLFNYYLKALDMYVRCYFLPPGYEKQDFSTTSERFYSLKAQLKKEKDYLCLSFPPTPGLPFLKDLEYACHRINEKEIVFADGKRLWCSL